MARRYNDPIAVYKPIKGTPFFIWRGRRYDIGKVLNTVRTASNLLSGGQRRDIFHVSAKADRGCATGIYEICFDRLRGNWMLTRVMD